MAEAVSLQIDTLRIGAARVEFFTAMKIHVMSCSGL
jgi:hypothetical protein